MKAVVGKAASMRKHVEIYYQDGDKMHGMEGQEQTISQVPQTEHYIHINLHLIEKVGSERHSASLL